MLLRAEPAQHVLLTGAGFTHNFGGFLAEQFWVELLNQPAVGQNPKLLSLLKKDFDFEAIYTHILESDKYSQDLKDAMRQSTWNVFREMHGRLQDWNPDNPSYPVDGSQLDQFLKKFLARPKSSAFMFTLNQDLFLEIRGCGFDADARIPGVDPPSGDRWFGQGGQPPASVRVERAAIVSDDEETIKRHFVQSSGCYVKLHGSCNWYYPDGTGRMLLGYGKSKQWKEDPLFNIYRQVFEEVLQHKNRKLLVIGYSFRDKHINEALIRAVPHGLKLYILDPTPPRIFKDRLFQNVTDKGLKATAIWNSIVGYFPYRFRDLFPFPVAKSPSPAVKQILRSLDVEQ